MSLTISGSNFRTGTVSGGSCNGQRNVAVNVNGNQIADSRISSVTSTSIVVSIPASYFTSEGNLSIVVGNRVGQGNACEYNNISSPTTLTVAAVPAAPVVNSNERCGPGILPLNVVNPPADYIYRWYNAPTGGSIVFSGNEESPSGASFSPNLSTDAVYYVSAVNTAGNCLLESTSRTAVTAKVKPQPTSTLSYVPNGPQCAPASGGTRLTYVLSGTLTNAANPVFEIIAGDDIANLIVNRNDPYSPTLRVMGAGTVTVRFSGTSTNGCNPPSSTVDIVVNPTTTTVSDLLESQEVTAGEPVTFTAVSNLIDNGDAEEYQWYIRLGNGPYEPQGAFTESNEFTIDEVPDNLTGVRVDIVVADGACYTETFQSGDLTLLSIESGPITPLPVELLYLSAYKTGQHVLLEWATAMEDNNAGFEVQVSEDGTNFRKLAFVETRNGNAQYKQLYRYTDAENGKHGTRYYRLKQQDQNGKFAYFGPRVVTFSEVVAQVKAFPNPFSTAITLDVAAEQDGEMVVRMVNPVGRQVLEHRMQVKRGFNSEELHPSDDLPMGMYVLTVYLNGNVYHHKLLRQ